MIEGLNLQAAGIGVDAHGAIVVNDQLHTTVPHVWAMGDVKGGPQFTYLSLDDFRIIRDQLFGDKKRDIGDRPCSLCRIYRPAVWLISDTEEEALKKVFFRFPFAGYFCGTFAHVETDRRHAESTIVNDHSGKIMGCTLFALKPRK